ncbi:sensor histidine kinase N-terminal domain-containing protein [Pseudomonas sp. PDM12]|jgi:two-component system sensor histidine kinase QseC|uniref:ATP-binding protein n=1 Tax=Pseudomonas sp. PDM12 TaxID=2769260 RepID=UPI001784CB43|nr:MULTISPECIES: ATP-binding protein [unclassified Pseudomonas]MBD9655342.1 sensor histidine kinase N-terminal domain-containing protein [Pseudomonas sp. PDM12]
MTSLRRRTLVLVLGLLLLGTLTISLYNFHDSRHEIGEIYDAQLAQSARLLQGAIHAQLPEEQRQALYRAFNAALSQAGSHRIGHPYEGKMAFQVWDREGHSLIRSSSAPAFEQPVTTPGFSDQTLYDVNWHGFLLPDERHGLQIWVGEREDVRQDLVNRIVRHTLIPNLIGIVVLSALIWLAIGWGLRPLQNMAQIIRKRHGGSLEPLQLTPLPRELEPMQAALNRLLSQIEQLLQRERRFIGDAAHEMRTPLATLRIHAQNALQASQAEPRNKALNHLLGGVDRLTRVVNQLLTLARVEPQVARQAWQPVDLEATVRQALVELTPWMLGKGLELALEVQPGRYLIHGDGPLVEIALQNLVTNAANFSPEGAEVEVLLSTDGEQHLVLSVRDHGPGIDEEKIERLFERFYSRDNPGGAGLGLSIVEMIASHLGGSITLGNHPDGGLLATLLLPRAPHDES